MLVLEIYFLPFPRFAAAAAATTGALRMYLNMETKQRRDINAKELEAYPQAK